MKRILSLSILIIIIFCNCNKSTSTTSTTIIVPPPATIVNDSTSLPSTTGTYWKYSVYDSLSGIQDTVIITVMGKGKLDDGTDAIKWNYESQNNGLDSMYITYNQRDTKTYYENSATTILKRYIFPMALGNKWITQYWADTNYITKKDSIRTLAEVFPEAYRINRDVAELPPPVFIIKEEEWFVPNVGMVKRDLYETSWPNAIHQMWELVQYKIQ